METTLYYFSGTGNSYQVAKELQKQIKDCSLIAITEECKKSRIECISKNVGIVFPLYFQSMPKVVMDFIEKLDLHKFDYIFAVVTRGGKAYQGGALHHMNKLLKIRNSRLSAGFYVRMPDNFIPLLKVPSKKEQVKILSEASNKIRTISNLIKSRHVGIESEFSSFLRPMMHNRFIRNLHNRYKGFNVNDSCNSCGLCEKICKFNNINLEDKKPNWGSNCQFCLACINYCPSASIEYNNSTIGKERYHHPEVPSSIYIKV